MTIEISGKKSAQILLKQEIFYKTHPQLLGN